MPSYSSFKNLTDAPGNDFVSISSFCSIFLEDGDLENHDVSGLSQDTLDTIEADSFWCMSKLLDGIQVNLILYILEKPFTLKEALEISPKQIEEIQRQSQIITGERLPPWSHSFTTKIILFIFTTENDSSNLAHRLLIAFSDLEKSKYKKISKKTTLARALTLRKNPIEPP